MYTTDNGELIPHQAVDALYQREQRQLCAAVVAGRVAGWSGRYAWVCGVEGHIAVYLLY